MRRDPHPVGGGIRPLICFADGHMRFPTAPVVYNPPV